MIGHLAGRGLRVTGVDLSPAMVALARRHHPGHPLAVGSLADLPFADATFDGVMLWYSTIHTVAEHRPRLYAEAARVLRPGGRLLVAFQAGRGIRDTAPTYRRLGHDVALVRHLVTADQASGWARAAGLDEVCRMVRRPRGAERDDQAALIARKAAG